MSADHHPVCLNELSRRAAAAGAPSETQSMYKLPDTQPSGSKKEDFPFNDQIKFLDNQAVMT